MKKIFLTFLILCMCFMCFSCSEDDIEVRYKNFPLYSGFDNIISTEDQYEVLLLSGTESTFHVKSGEYIIADYEKYSNIVPNETEVITILGETIVGEYDRTIHPSNMYSPSFSYNAENCSFSVNAEGQLCYLTFTKLDIAENKELSKDKYLEIATNFIDSLNIVDVSQYRTNVKKLENGKKCYNVSFVKYVGDFETDDYANVYVTYDGKIDYYSASAMFGDISTDIYTGGINTDKLLTSIGCKLEELCANVKDVYPYIEFKDQKMCLTVLKEGNMGFLYSAGVSMAESENSIISSNAGRFSMVIVIE